MDPNTSKYRATEIARRNDTPPDERIYGLVVGSKRKKGGRYKVRANLDGSATAASNLADCSLAKQDGTIVTNATPHYASPAADVICTCPFYALTAAFKHEAMVM